MLRAATALARRCAAVLGRVYGSRVVVLAGSGDNGGDALYAAASLARRGARVDVLATGTLHEGGWATLSAAGGHRFAAGGGGGAGDRVAPGSPGLLPGRPGAVGGR